MENPLSKVEAWDLVADGYAAEVMPVFEKWTKDSIDRIKPGPADIVMDIATGPGTVALMVAPLVKAVEAIDFSPNMINHLVSRMMERKVTNIRAKFGDCQKLSCWSDTIDIAFSHFGIMFFADRAAGFSEMYRVLKPGGRAAVYSWGPLSESPAQTMMVRAMTAGFPETSQLKKEADNLVKGLDDPDTFRTEMEAAGFQDVTIEPVTHSFPVPSPEQFWESMARGSAPIVLLKSTMDPEQWAAKEAVSKQYVLDNLAGATELSSTAYLGIGRKGS